MDESNDSGGYSRVEDIQPAERPDALRWQQRCHILNLLAGVVCWVAVGLPIALDGRYYWPLLPIVAAMPPVALFVVWISHGAVDLIDNKRLNGPSVLLLTASPLVLAWKALDWPLVDGWIAWASALCLAAPVTAKLAQITRKAGHSLTIRGPVIYGLAVAYIGSVIVLANVGHDRRPPQAVEAELSSVNQTSSYNRRVKRGYRVRLRPWDLRPYGVTFKVLSNPAAVGDRYCNVLVHPGTLGLRWLSLGSCYPTSRRMLVIPPEV